MAENIVDVAITAIILAVCFGAAAIIFGANAGLVSGLVTVIVKLAVGVAVIGVFAIVILSFVRALIP